LAGAATSAFGVFDPAMATCDIQLGGFNAQLEAWWALMGSALQNVLNNVIDPLLEKIQDVIDKLESVSDALAEGMTAINCCAPYLGQFSKAFGSTFDLGLCPVTGSVRGLMEWFENQIMSALNVVVELIANSLNGVPAIDLDLSIDKTFDFRDVIGEPLATCGVPAPKLDFNLKLADLNFDIKQTLLDNAISTVNNDNLGTSIMNAVDDECEDAVEAFKSAWSDIGSNNGIPQYCSDTHLAACEYLENNGMEGMKAVNDANDWIRDDLFMGYFR